MVTDYYLQNRTFDKNRDIECGGSMFVGSNVTAIKSNFLYDVSNHNPLLSTSETKKTVSINNVIVKSGSTVLLEAKNLITFKTGFKAENGSSFNAKVDGTNPNTRSGESSNNCGRISRVTNDAGTVKYGYSGNSDVAWNLKGYLSEKHLYGNEVEIPDYLKKGQYTLSAIVIGCNIPSIVVDIQHGNHANNEFTFPGKNEKSDTWKVAPNPGDNEVTIESRTPFVSVGLYDLEGKGILKKAVDEGTLILEVNVSRYTSGTYLISIKLKDGSIESKRIVIQH